MEFRVLGPLEVEVDGRVLKLGGAKQRALLALLLLHANEAVSRDRLIDELWGEHTPETASAAIQVYVSQLRKLLGRDAIVTQPPGYLIRVEEGDARPRALRASRWREREAAPADEAAELLRQALALWRGPPLAELDGSFARAERGRLDGAAAGGAGAADRRRPRARAPRAARPRAGRRSSGSIRSASVSAAS